MRVAIAEHDMATPADRVLLEGPHSRLKELWLVLRTVRDFIRGFRTLHFVGPCVTIFGSARFKDVHPYYAMGREVGRRVGRLGSTVMTGGGPGLMEAANRGAKDAGVTCQHFFVRKVLLFKYSYAFIALPGGIGTMDELLEALTLIQTKKIESFPIVLVGASYWQPLLGFFHGMVADGTIAATDLDLLLVTDDLDEAMRHLERHAIERFGLIRHPRPSRWLGEPVLDTTVAGG